MLCRVLEVSRAGYYAWEGREASARQKANAALVERIQQVHQDSRRTYGSPRVQAELKAQGLPVGRHRVARQWDALTRFVEDVRLPLDNNASERALRVAALGRKDFLFVGHDRAGRNLAGLYSLVATCSANGINPREYLSDVLLRVQYHPASRLDELLPGPWSRRLAANTS
ncbi:IS66 family transposase [Myxococcus stipitatus]|nr:transposase [Myxococcus stipitatus]